MDKDARRDADAKEGASPWARFSAGEIPSTIPVAPEVLELLRAESRILDLGCGGGRVLTELVERGCRRLAGVDLSWDALTAARQRLPSEVGLAAADAANLPFRSSTFDAVLTQAFWTTLPTAALRRAVIEEVARVLHPRGVLHVADFDLNSDDPYYARRYAEGAAKGYEPGTFDVWEGERLLYLAHHFSREEIGKLPGQGGLVEEQYYPRIFRTRSGREAKGHLLIAIKP